MAFIGMLLSPFCSLCDRSLEMLRKTKASRRAKALLQAPPQQMKPNNPFKPSILPLTELHHSLCVSTGLTHEDKRVYKESETNCCGGQTLAGVWLGGILTR